MPVCYLDGARYLVYTSDPSYSVFPPGRRLATKRGGNHNKEMLRGEGEELPCLAYAIGRSCRDSGSPLLLTVVGSFFFGVWERFLWGEGRVRGSGGIQNEGYNFLGFLIVLFFLFVFRPGNQDQVSLSRWDRRERGQEGCRVCEPDWGDIYLSGLRCLRAGVCIRTLFTTCLVSLPRWLVSLANWHLACRWAWISMLRPICLSICCLVVLYICSVQIGAFWPDVGAQKRGGGGVR